MDEANKKITGNKIIRNIQGSMCRKLYVKNVTK